MHILPQKKEKNTLKYPLGSNVNLLCREDLPNLSLQAASFHEVFPWIVCLRGASREVGCDPHPPPSVLPKPNLASLPENERAARVCDPTVLSL